MRVGVAAVLGEGFDDVNVVVREVDVVEFAIMFAAEVPSDAKSLLGALKMGAPTNQFEEKRGALQYYD